MVWMIVSGWIVFDQLPDRWTLAGAADHRGQRPLHRPSRAPAAADATARRRTPRTRRWQKSFDLHPEIDGIRPPLNSLNPIGSEREDALAQKIKLSTIADALGVSTATVSLALRDSPLVADATRDRIKEHARAIGYIYNRRAASLRTSRSGIVGVVVHDIMNPFFAEILRSIESELDRSRQTFILSNHYDQLEKQRTFIDTLLQLGADGVIMSPAIGTPAEDIIMAEENGLPAVLIARSVEGADVPVFRGDDAYGTGLATNHLISLGHKRIAMIGGTDQTSTGRDRYQGYVDGHGDGRAGGQAVLAHSRPAHQAGGLRGRRPVPGAEGSADGGLLLERSGRHRPDERHRARRSGAGRRHFRHRL